MREGWKYDKIGRICETSSGGTPSKSIKEYYDGGNIPWLRSGEISQGLIYNTELYITEEGLKNSSAKLFPIDTVVIAMYGATVGQVGVLKKTMATNQAVCGIFPSPLLSPHFLVYYLKAKKSYFLNLAAGGAQSNISQNIIKDTLIPILPLPEQQKIVEELDCLSNMIELKKKQLETYDKLAKAIFYEMFGDPIANDKGWKIMKLGDACVPKKYILRANKVFEKNDKILYIDISSVDNIRNVLVKPLPCNFGDAPSRAQQVVSKGDVLISLVRPNLKNIAMILSSNNNLVASSGFCVLRPNMVISQYIKQLILTNEYTEYLMGLISGANYPAVREDDIKSCIVAIPPLTLQHKFAEKIESIEKQKDLIKKSLQEVETLFNSRMDYYFN